MILETQDLHKRYGSREVVRGVNLGVDEGEIVGLLGPNGAGKTTTFEIIAGLIHPDRGSVIFDGQDISRWPISRRAIAGLGYLPQEASVFRRLSVEDNLRLVLEMRHLDPKEVDQRINAALQQFDLESARFQIASALSGGERRRVEVARAAVTRPRLLLLDEPFTGIDPIATQELQRVVAGLKEAGYGVLITDHNVRDTLAIVDRAYILHKGEVLVSGPAPKVAAHAAARKFFFGERFDYAG